MEEKVLIPLVFEHEEFGKIRTLGDWENPLFCLADVCRALDDLRVDGVVTRLKGDPNTAGGISIHPIVDSLGRTQMVNFIDEPCLYRVIFTSRKPNALKFQDWIFREVIPSIRKTGSYTLPNEEPALKNLPPHLADPKRLCVYAVAMSDDTVKIGKTNDYRRRANELKRESALEILRAYRTGYLPSRIASDIESDCLRAFDSCRKHGEFLNASFAKVCAKVSERAIAIIETDRAIYVTKWPDAKAEYDQFISEIPATETGDASELSLKEKLCVLLECARITNSDTFRDEILREAIAITIGKQF